METEPDSSPHPKIDAKIVLDLAWPAVTLNSLQVINTLLDRAFVGSLPDTALKSVGGAMSIQFLMFSIAMSLSVAATALVSRAYGAGANREVRKAARQSLSLSLLISFGVVLLGLVIAPVWANVLFRDNPAVRQSMVQFIHFYLLGLPFIFMLQMLAGSLRGVGDTKSPMVISGIQIGLHILLNFLLIFPSHRVGSIVIPGANWGINGSAIALSTSACLATFGYMFFMSRTPIGNVWKLERPEKEWVGRMLKIAMPTVGMSVLRVASLSTFSVILSQVPHGEAAMAALPVAFSLESIMFMPAFGFSMAATTLVGQSLGMHKPERAERLAWLSSHFAAIIVLAMVLPIATYAKPIAGMMIQKTEPVGTILTDRMKDGSEPKLVDITQEQQKDNAEKDEIIRQAIFLIRILCLTEVLFAYNMVMTGGMQGAGDTVRPLWITIVSLWFLRVPGAYVLAIWLKQGAHGAFWSMSVSQGIGGIMAMLAFKQGHWKTVSVGVGEGEQKV